VASPEDLDELPNTVLMHARDAGLDENRSRHFQAVVIGPGTFATFPLSDGAMFTIGRSPTCDITIDDESISRRHAILRLGDVLTIEDLGSANGTVVNGDKLPQGVPAPITVGELIGVGKASLIVQQRSEPVRARRMLTHDYFEVRLEEQCARTRRTGAAFALLHLHPDRGASASFVEEALAEVVRDSDILGKYGPCEYELLLPDTTPDKADEAKRRMQTVLLARELRCRISVACCPRDGQSPYQLASKVRAHPAAAKPTTARNDIVVADPQMQSLHRMVEQVAGSQISVLLLGETGVGKEVFARALHHLSPRRDGPFVEINCAALPEALLESELFGHEKGAFTNAIAAKPGLIESANDGTLLLDEIGEMPMATQAKLLRVIEDAQLRRVGALKSRPIDVRFVASTNRDLEAQIAAGAFRGDLYFRLNGITLVIPSLRERPDELEPLARAFILRASQRDDKPVPALSPDAIAAMKAYGWPGNVRELRNVIERAVLLADGEPIRSEHLPLEKMRSTVMATPRAPANGPSSSRPRKGSAEERRWILQALERAGGNQTTAARMLGMSRRTLVNRLNEHDVADRPRKPAKDD
jgi:two-component system response regulator AtoC